MLNSLPIGSSTERSTSGASGELRVLVIEEHTLVRIALRSLISATPGFIVVGEAPSFTSASELARQHGPQVILVGGSMLAAEEDADIEELRRAAPDACILVLAQGGLEPADAPAAAHGCLQPNAG